MSDVPGKGRRPKKPSPEPRDLTATLTDRIGVDDMSRDIYVTFGAGAPEVEPPTGELLWSADYESNNLNTYFDATSWNNVPTAPVIVTGPVAAGAYAGAYAIPSGGSRCENVPTGVTFTEGDDLWISMKVRTSNVPTTTNWQVVGCQWKNDGVGSPPLAMDIDNGVWNIGGGWGWPGTDTPTTPKDTTRTMGAHYNDVWEHFVFHIVFHSNPAIGKVDAWRNGTQVVTDYYPDGGTLYPSLDSYWKVGYYRSTSITQGATVYLDDIRLGTTASAVGGTG